MLKSEPSNIAEPDAMEHIEYSEHDLKDSSSFREDSKKSKPLSIPSSNPKDDGVPKDDLFLCLRPVLAIGQVFGCFPFGGAINMNLERLPYLTFSSRVPFIFCSLLIAVRGVISIVLVFMNLVTGAGITITTVRLIFNSIENCLVKIDVWLNVDKYIAIFKTWRIMNANLWSRKEDAHLRWKLLILSWALFAIIFTENWLNSFRNFVEFGKKSGGNITFIEASYAANDEIWFDSFTSHSFIAELVAFVEHKLLLYGTTAMALFQICLVISIDRKFQDLVSCMKAGPINWKAAREDYFTLRNFVEKANDILSFQLFPVMEVNLYFTTSWVYMAITSEEKSLLVGVFTTFAVAYLLLRFLLFCIPAGNIYEVSTKIWTIIQQCPDKEYDADVKRLEKLTAKPIGFTCLGLFTITRPFMLSFLNAVFTLVVIMLQVDLKKNGYYRLRGSNSEFMHSSVEKIYKKLGLQYITSSISGSKVDPMQTTTHKEEAKGNMKGSLRSDDLFFCLRPVLVLGQIFGAFPFGGVLRYNKQALPVLSIRSALPFIVVAASHSVFAILAIALAGKELVGHDIFKETNPIEVLQRVFWNLVSSFMLIARNIFIIRNGQKIISMFHTWRIITLRSWSNKEDKTLKKKIYLILGVLFATMYTDHALVTYRNISEEMTKKNISALEASYRADMSVWADSIVYHPLLGILSGIHMKLIVNLTLLSSALVSCVTVALKSKFQALVAHIESTYNANRWKQAREDYLSLCFLVEKVNDSLSFFILYEMIHTLYYTSILAYTAITPSGHSVVTGMYAIMALTHLVSRFLIFCIPAGGIHDASEQMWMLVQQCPEAEYNDEVNRLERLVARPMGFSCMGLFTITRSFPLKFFNVVFTFVIVLLQATSNQKMN